MTKKELRVLYKEKRMQLSHSQKAKMDDLLLIEFQKLEIDIPDFVMTYAGLESANEFDPGFIADYCAFKNPDIRLLYPVIFNDDTNQMQPILVNDNTVFERNKYGIDEPLNGTVISPIEIDLIFVPLLVFDKQGNRVGYGKGYYDRFFKDCKKDVVKIGFSYFDPIDAIDDINEFDIKLDCCITPSSIYYFN